eukprot:GAHX01000861.1.p1 GENE.GAHX01000861.1~~GAHX01000861.1.p1  ORF type:complete len:576 (-),score=142.94 GAHX01000861.1:33-1715(-)
MDTQTPIYVLRNIKNKQSSNKALLGNIQAAMSVSEMIRSTLGPNGMMKMIVSKMGTVITNDGNCVLRDIDFEHPAAKFIVELSYTQAQEAGDGTTSVILLSCQLLECLYPLIKDMDFHPNELLSGLVKFQSTALSHLKEIVTPVDFKELLEKGNNEKIYETIRTTLGSKVVFNYENLIFDLVFKAMKSLLFKKDDSVSNNKWRGMRNWRDLIKLEKLEGGLISESYVLNGVVLKKEPVTTLMRTHIENPKILVLSGGLEYKKIESQTELEMANKDDIENLIHMEEKYIEDICMAIEKLGASIVFCDKGTSPLADHLLSQMGVVVFRNNTKPALDRICKACNADYIAPSELVELVNENKDDLEYLKSKVGESCEDFELKRINDEFISFIRCNENSSSCSIVLRGASSSTMKEIEANIEDAIGVLFTLFKTPKILPGGGAVEIYLYDKIISTLDSLDNVDGKEREVIKRTAEALLVVPKTLGENCGKSGLEIVQECLDANMKHATEGKLFGVNAVDGSIQNSQEAMVFDAYGVKEGVLKTSINSASMMLRIGDVLSGLSKIE